MLGSKGKCVVIIESVGIPKERYKAYNHKYHKQRSICSIRGIVSFIFLSFGYADKIANPEYQEKDIQDQNYAKDNYQTHHKSLSVKCGDEDFQLTLDDSYQPVALLQD